MTGKRKTGFIISTLKAGYLPSREGLSIPSLSLEAEGGHLISILGLNGSGKTTLLRLLDGQLPYEGSILLETGKDTRELKVVPPKQRAVYISYLPQELGRPEIEVGSLVMHGRYAKMHFPRVPGEKDHEAVERALERTGMTGLKDRLVTRLSGGQKKKAYLAMSLAQDTGILLLDEPEAAMDPGSRAELWQLAGDLRAEGRLVIMTSHDPELAFTWSDRVLLMKDGAVIGDGTPDALSDSDEIRKTLGVSLIPAPEGALSRWALGKIR